jgi:hypothetical protein
MHGCVSIQLVVAILLLMLAVATSLRVVPSSKDEKSHVAFDDTMLAMNDIMGDTREHNLLSRLRAPADRGGKENNQYIARPSLRIAPASTTNATSTTPASSSFRAGALAGGAVAGIVILAVCVLGVGGYVVYRYNRDCTNDTCNQIKGYSQKLEDSPPGSFPSSVKSSVTSESEVRPSSKVQLNDLEALQ